MLYGFLVRFISFGVGVILSVCVCVCIVVAVFVVFLYVLFIYLCFFFIFSDAASRLIHIYVFLRVNMAQLYGCVCVWVKCGSGRIFACFGVGVESP